MSGPNISGYGGFGTQDPNAYYIQSGQNVTGANEDIQEINVREQSTIQKSQLDAFILMLAAGFPFLPPPQVMMTSFLDSSGGSGGASRVGSVANASTQINMQVAQTNNDIINSMWDNFLKNVRELAERARKEDIKKWTDDANQAGPKSAAEYYAYLMALSSTQRANEISGDGNAVNALAVQFNQTFNQWLGSPSANVQGVSNDNYPSASYVAGSLAASSDAVRDAIGASGLTIGYQLSVSPVADAIYAVGPSSGLPTDYQAAAALVAALLNNGAAFKASKDTIQQAAANGQPPQDLNFAINYAKNIMNIVTHKLDGEESLSPEQSSKNRMIRLILTSMAMLLLYRTAFGGKSGPEFASLLDPNTVKNLPEAIRPQVEQLAALIKNYLPDDPNAKADALAGLMEYADSSQSVDSMLSTTRMFSTLLTANDNIINKRLEAS